MISIEYTSERLENEPGPNFYWRGKPHDFLVLVNDLHPLGCNDSIEMCLNKLEYIKVSGQYRVTARASSGGKTLCKVSGNCILIDLSSNIWRRILELLLRISFYPSHHYIDLDEFQLIEDAGFIVSSEA
jgi:hypothetical protein